MELNLSEIITCENSACRQAKKCLRYQQYMYNERYNIFCKSQKFVCNKSNGYKFKLKNEAD